MCRSCHHFRGGGGCPFTLVSQRNPMPWALRARGQVLVVHLWKSRAAACVPFGPWDLRRHLCHSLRNPQPWSWLGKNYRSEQSKSNLIKNKKKCKWISQQSSWGIVIGKGGPREEEIRAAFCLLSSLVMEPLGSMGWGLLTAWHVASVCPCSFIWGRVVNPATCCRLLCCFTEVFKVTAPDSLPAAKRFFCFRKQKYCMSCATCINDSKN